jgi:MoaA/NifB/PqqE/SkfB family radical SAM enzyme
MNSKQIYCSAPWQGVTIREDGLVRTCCAGTTILGNLHDSDIEDIMKSKRLVDIRNNLLQGKSDQNCSSCEKNEQHGRTSLREFYAKNYPFEDQTLRLKFVDIRWNNHCNLACVYCGPYASSEWEKIANIPVLSTKKPYQERLLEWILHKTSEIQEISLVGGEPMLMKQNYHLIKKLPQSSRLSIITNLSYDISKLSCLQDLLDRPRSNTIWNVSVENTEAKFEYLRRGAKWHQFLKNLVFIVEHWPDNVNLLMTYGIFSALDLHKNIEFFHSIGINKFHLQSLERHPEFEVVNMPVDLKTASLECLLRIKAWHDQTFGIDKDLYPIQNIDILINQIQNQSAPMTTWQQFHDKITYLDSLYQGPAFQTLWPEIVSSISR